MAVSYTDQLERATWKPIYHGGLRLMLGAFRTSSAESLYAEANESCKLALQYYVKLKSCPTNLAHHKVFHPKYKSDVATLALPDTSSSTWECALTFSSSALLANLR